MRQIEDRYCIGTYAITVITHNPDSDACGTFEIHTIPYREIEEVIKKNGKLTEYDIDGFLEDAYSCKTGCIDNGSFEYSELMDNLSGYDTTDDRVKYFMKAFKKHYMDDYVFTNDIVTRFYKSLFI